MLILRLEILNYYWHSKDFNLSQCLEASRQCIVNRWYRVNVQQK